MQFGWRREEAWPDKFGCKLWKWMVLQHKLLKVKLYVSRRISFYACAC